MSGFRMRVMEGPLHVVPIDDTVSHTTSPHCWCQPTREQDEDMVEPLFVHHSADGRERDEPNAYPPATRH